MFPVFRPKRKPAVPGLLLLRRDTGPEQGARSESRRDSEGSGRGTSKEPLGQTRAAPPLRTLCHCVCGWKPALFGGNQLHGAFFAVEGQTDSVGTGGLDHKVIAVGAVGNVPGLALTNLELNAGIHLVGLIGQPAAVVLLGVAPVILVLLQYHLLIYLL